jgi:hypothetical protein
MQHHYKLTVPITNWIRPNIDLDWYPKEFPPTPWGEARNWALQYPSSDLVLSKEAIDFLNSINILPSVDGANTVNLFRGDPKADMHIHKDPGPRWSLNFVFGSNDSDMIWYREGPDAKTRMWTSVTGRQAMSYEPAGMIEVDRVCMQGLQLVRIDVPHSVENRSASTRWAACVKDRTKDWTWDEAVEYFQPWILE